jgi:hypothetical protein
LAYSTVTAPAAVDVLADNQVVVIDSAGEPTHRVGFTRAGATTSSWGPITCTSVVKDGIEVRVIRLADHDDLVRLLVSGYAVPQRPVPGARHGLRSEVAILLGDGKQLSREHDQENPFGSGLLINSVEFPIPGSDRVYAVGISLTDQDREVSWPTGAQGDGTIKINWPDGTSQLINSSAGSGRCTPRGR